MTRPITARCRDCGCQIKAGSTKCKDCFEYLIEVAYARPDASLFERIAYGIAR